MAYSAPRTWVGGETLTAALLNTELRDNLLAGFPTGSLHYYIRAATTTETLVNGFALECNGVTPLRTTYATLNTLLSGLAYPFGAGNGSTTFTLPDIQGRGLVAMASGGHVDVNALGDSDGQAKTSRTPQIGSHAHFTPDHTHPNGTTSINSVEEAVASGAGLGVADSPHTHEFLTPSGGGGVTSGDGGSFGNYLVAGIFAVKT